MKSLWLMIPLLALNICPQSFLSAIYSCPSLHNDFELEDPMQSGYAQCVMEYLEYNLHTQKHITNAIGSIVSICKLKKSSELYATCKQIYDDIVGKKPINDDWCKYQIHKLFDVTNISMQEALHNYRAAKKIEKQQAEAEDGVLGSDEDLIIKAVVNMIGHSIEKRQMRIRSNVYAHVMEGYADQIFVFVTKKKKILVCFFGHIIDEASVLTPSIRACRGYSTKEYLFLC